MKKKEEKKRSQAVDKGCIKMISPWRVAGVGGEGGGRRRRESAVVAN